MRIIDKKKNDTIFFLFINLFDIFFDKERFLLISITKKYIITDIAKGTRISLVIIIINLLFYSIYRVDYYFLFYKNIEGKQLKVEFQQVIDKY